MAPKQKKVAPPTIARAVPAKKANGQPTRAEKKARNSAQYRAAQKALIKQIAIPIPRTADGHGPLVVQGDKPRPTKYSAELSECVCTAFATNTRMTLSRLNADPTMPTVMTVYKWLVDHPEFEKAYTHARQIQQDMQAEELADDAEAIRRGEIRVTKSGTDAQGNSFDSEEVRVIDNVDRSRLYVETRKWLLSKQRPKKYGIQPVEVDNTNGGLTDLLAQFRARSKELENEPS